MPTIFPVNPILAAGSSHTFVSSRKAPLSIRDNDFAPLVSADQKSDGLMVSIAKDTPAGTQVIVEDDQGDTSVILVAPAEAANAKNLVVYAETGDLFLVTPVSDDQGSRLLVTGPFTQLPEMMTFTSSHDVPGNVGPAAPPATFINPIAVITCVIANLDSKQLLPGIVTE
jgi:hypothetical protein